MGIFSKRGGPEAGVTEVPDSVIPEAPKDDMRPVDAETHREGKDEERRELSDEREAWDTMKELEANPEYVADMFNIPIEELVKYKSAAETLLKRAEEDDNFNPPEELIRLATEVQKIPE